MRGRNVNTCFPSHIFTMKLYKTNKEEWWQNFFNEDYIKTYIDITSPKLTAQQVSFLINKLKLTAKKKILDLGCGYGRHTLELSKRGFKVTGFDYSKTLLAIATREAEKEGVTIKYIKGDMRQLHFKNAFDIIICMFTTFGFFLTHQEHEIALQKINQALKPGGKFLLDINNPGHSLESIIKNGRLNKKKGIVTHRKVCKLSNGLKVFITQEFNLETMRWKLTRKWREGKQYKAYTWDIYLFTLPEIKFLLEKSKFSIEQVWGNFDGSGFNFNSRRLIILAKK